MSIELGDGSYRFRLDRTWGRLPDGWRYHEVSAVGVDGKDRVYVFSRGKHPVVVFDRDGNFLRSWGEGVFKFPRHSHRPGQLDLLYR